MSEIYPHFKLTPLYIALSLVLSSPILTADFTILDGTTINSTQTLNANETGTINEGGQISTAGVGVNASDTNHTVNNSGSISTTGDNADAIHSTGAAAAISNSGSILTSGENASGISTNSDNATISNSGSITITTLNPNGSDSHGIESTGENATISNSGSISTRGDETDGIESTGENATISNSGSILTSGEDGIGIWSTGSNAIINNSGSISISGEDGIGIGSSGVNAIISNSGSISTSEEGAYGIWSRSSGSNASISNSGSISTSGEDAFGIRSSGGNAVISNSGSISTSGEDADGIRSSGGNAVISNSGSISVTDNDSSGINSQSTNATLNNSGLISATNLAVFGATNNILNLLPGSQIIGRINLGEGADNDTANVYGGSVSANLTFENTENINLFGAGVVIGTNVITVDATGESTRGVALAIMASSIHGVISQRMNQTTPVQAEALKSSSGIYVSERQPVAWAEFFGGGFDRDAESSTLGYDHDHAGINFGYEWDVNQNRLGLMGGLVVSDTETQVSSFLSESTNFYIGAYGNRKVNGVNITGSLLAGYGDHDNERLVIDNINGQQVAKSDFKNFFISPAVTVAQAYTLSDKIELRPRANIAYSVAWLDSYTETGTSNSNMSVDARKAKALTAKVQLAAAYALSNSSELEVRVGINSRQTNDDDIHASVSGSQFTFANAGDKNVTGSFAGTSLRILNENNLTLVADVEVGGDRHEDYVAGSITVEYVF
jgi:hypothetical protein